MKTGLLLPQSGDSATTENLLYIAKEAEEYGINSVWVFERLLWPLKPQTRYLGTPNGSLPNEYQTVLDPLDTLAYLAGNVKNISLGTCLIDMLFHNPVVLARRFATIDILSEGRLIAGLGIGWSKDEYDVCGIPYKNRGARADEFLQVLHKIWTNDIVEFEGKYYNIPASKIGPKPIQKPHPPIILGGFAQTTFLRIVNYADGWIPVVGYGPLEQLEKAINGLKESVRKADKDPSKIRIIVLAHPNVLDHSSKTSAIERSPMTGTIDQIGSDIDQIKTMGVEHLIFGYTFSPIGKDMKKMIEITTHLARFAN